MSITVRNTHNCKSLKETVKCPEPVPPANCVANYGDIEANKLKE